MATIGTIGASDTITSSRTVINDNFDALNTDKIETDVLDTDTTLAANSDAKIATQKAVKAYVDAGGNVNASSTLKGIVEEATAAEVSAGTAAGATGAQLFVNPAIAITSNISGVRSVNAGATIAGATTPVPVYQNKTDNEFYACDANDNAAYKFLGFAITNGTNGNPFKVQFSGIVGGFSALDEGEKYYVQDAVGTIGTAPGTTEILVGVAISTTELVIQKSQRHASGQIDLSAVTGTGSSAITLGFRPSTIRMTAYAASSGHLSVSTGKWANAVLQGVSAVYNEGSDGATYADMRIFDGNSPTDFLVFTITTVTDTGFTIVYTETATFGTISAILVWEAEGEL